MKQFLALATAISLIFVSNFAKADHLEKGAFICRSKELLSEMTSAAVKYKDGKNMGNEKKASEGMSIISSLIINDQCSITDKEYQVSMIESGILKHKVRLYDNGKNSAVWTHPENYIRD